MSKLIFHSTPEEDARVAGNQCKFIRDLANKVEAGEPLNNMERRWAAGILSAWADQIPDRAPKKQGTPMLQPGDIAGEFAILVQKYGPRGKNKAHEELAGRYEVSIKAIKEAIKKCGDAADSWISTQKKK